MLPLVAATFVTAGVGLALFPYVVFVEDTAPTSQRWDYMATVIQIAGLVLVLIATAIELRRRDEVNR